MGELMQCYSCGVTDATGTGLTRKKGRIQCESCADEHSSAGREGLFMWGLMAAAALSWTTDALLSIRYMLTSLSLIWIAGVTITVVHEAGHALAALMMGIRVRAINIGAGGPRMMRTSIGRFAFQVYLLPVGGSTILAPAKQIIRSRHFVVTLAGPLVHLAALILVWRWHPESWAIELFRLHLLWIGSFLVVTNLIIPMPRSGNDIYRIWQLLTAADQEIEAISGISEHDELARRLNVHEARDPMSDEELAEARRFLQKRLELPGLTAKGRAIESSNLAAVILMLEDPALLAEADKLSLAALSTFPHPSISANRGAVLVALERYEEAILLMTTALPKLTGSDGMSTRGALALAALETGDLYNGRRHLAAIGQPLNSAQYRKALELIGPAELANLITVYWTTDRSPSDIADLIRSDSQGMVPFIADGLGRALESMSAEEVATVVLENRSSDVDPSTARDVVAAVVAELSG